MKNFMYRKFLIPALVALLAACSSDPLREDTPQGGVEIPGSAKICNTSQNAMEGTLVARFAEEAIPVLERTAAELAATRSAATRSGLPDLDEILSDLSLVSIERVFPRIEEFESDTRNAGLHTWYLLKFDPEQDLDQAARLLSEVAEISTIQFSTKVNKHFDGSAHPFRAAAHGATRAMVTADFNDPDLFWQWHYINNADQAIATEARVGADINVADAWKLITGDPRVIVAVIDEGVKYTHPDLAGNMWVNPNPSPEYGGQDIHGWNFVTDGPLTWDTIEKDPVTGKTTGDSGHGTHVAGTIAAVNNNGIGVCGIAGGSGSGDGVRIMSCQIFAGESSSGDYMTSQAIKYAADHGASILQCSYGYEAGLLRSDNSFEEDSPLTKAALDYFRAKRNCSALDGGLIIYSAGNEETSMAGYPGAYRDYISVTAFSPDLLPAYYTNYGSGCNISAPGGELSGYSGGEKAGILSTLCSETSNGADYGYMQGTSMACPHVSGVAALGLSYALAIGKHFSLDEFTSMLLTSVNEMDSRFEGTKTSGATINLSSYIGKMGTGAIDAYQLLMQIEGTPCLKVPTGGLELLSLTRYFGGEADELTYTDVKISDADMRKLGITTAPKVYNGQLMIKCTKPGTARLRISAVAGGTRPGSGSVMGGMIVTKEFAVIARDTGADNGGWL